VTPVIKLSPLTRLVSPGLGEGMPSRTPKDLESSYGFPGGHIFSRRASTRSAFHQCSPCSIGPATTPSGGRFPLRSGTSRQRPDGASGAKRRPRIIRSADFGVGAESLLRFPPLLTNSRVNHIRNAHRTWRPSITEAQNKTVRGTTRLLRRKRTGKAPFAR